MLQGGFPQHPITRVATLAPCQQLVLQRSTHHLARFKYCLVAWFPVALSKTNRLVTKAAVLHPLLRHRRLLGFGPPPHAANYRPQPSARLIRQQLLDLDILPYKERHVKVTTCGDLYKKWRGEGRRGYEQAPETGAHVPVVYIHTGMDRMEQGDRTERPLTLMLTGAPGHYEDYGNNIPFLDQHGVDVLCFNWPDFGFTLETGYWWHSCDEKTRLVVDFLKKLQINKIDMLVSHSLGSTPALQLVAEDRSIDVKSLALLTPITTRHFRGSRNSLLFNPAVRWATKSRRGARFMIFFFKAVTMLSMHPTMGRPYDAFFAYHSSVGYDEHRVEQQLRTIRHRKVPTLVILGDNDRLLSKKDNRKLLRRLGCESEGACLYDADGNLLRSRSCDDVVKAIELKDGSHYGFARCPDICNKALLELISRVQER
ncbi:uncharacterized protein LOC119381623 [Rhipicephalus sanguineus]|uniref:uncharacterized protein LOC119381623 n=1 Tax=Rhipicephalus sanguineus TaxID=34632 RepID=UPI001894FDA0|nr:uncharacterized protein LOC119381623 [Rhipicephalus sanguineus]